MVTDEEVFTEAIGLPTIEAQRRYVAEACGEDMAQQHRVLGLLASHGQLSTTHGDFVLDRSEEVNALLSPQDPTVGTTIGPYHIKYLLGEGGMGLVYQAEQQFPIRRQVALKVLKPGMDSQKVLARFELERQALAGMEHPGITRIFDAGLTEAGRPYFVMELVKGVAITNYVETHQFQPLERVKLMIRVCAAIQHAHQRGIIHRDIKPSNVLIAKLDGGPLPKIIDFGIAKVVNDSLMSRDHFTVHGELIGTPAYMSPEQALSSAEGVDLRTDVYSLGVLLYELLTGETPLKGLQTGKGLVRLSQVLSDGRTDAPSQRVKKQLAAGEGVAKDPSQEWNRLARFLKGDVDCIVMKALAIDPDDRYQTVSELKRDLERFVEGQPIEAAPPRWRYRFQKWIQRHRALAAIVGLACGLVFTASAFAIRFGIVAQQTTQIANQRLQDVLEMQTKLEIERDRAIDAERKSRLLAQSYLMPALLERVASRFQTEHWEAMIAANPSLKGRVVPKEKGMMDGEVARTFYDSNLHTPDDRLVFLDDSKWLLKVLSEISKRDLASVFPPQGLFAVPYIGDTTPASVPATAAPVQFEPVMAEQIRPSSESPSESTVSVTWNPTFHFSLEARKAYLEIMCEELRSIDGNLPMVADTEDSLGLCWLDMKQPERALERFQESLRIRATYPELQLQILQTELWMADCQLRLEDRSGAMNRIARVRAELNKSVANREEVSVNRLRELAESLESR